jgi:hypothetical protein
VLNQGSEGHRLRVLEVILEGTAGKARSVTAAAREDGK